MITEVYCLLYRFGLISRATMTNYHEKNPRPCSCSQRADIIGHEGSTLVKSLWLIVFCNAFVLSYFVSLRVPMTTVFLRVILHLCLWVCERQTVQRIYHHYFSSSQTSGESVR